MASLVDLPTELIDQILLLVAEEDPPSKRFLHEEPSVSLLSFDDHPLKNLALTSRSLCRAARRHLLMSLKTDLDEIPSLLLFVEEQGLQGCVQSLVLFSTFIREIPSGLTAESYEQKINSAAWLRIKAIMDAVNPVSVTFMLPPRVFECILPYEIYLEDEWAFNIPCQTLYLERCPKADVEQSRPTAASERNIFGLRPWRHMTFNEGSSVQAYNTYEYYMKQSPSLLNPKGECKISHHFCSGLLSVDYIAVFPIHRDISLVEVIGKVQSVRSLRVQFAPSASNDVLDNPARLGRCQQSDLWSELRSSYGSVMWYIEFGPNYGCRLKKYTILDRFPGSMEMIKEELGGHEAMGWYLGSDGHSLERSI